MVSNAIVMCAFAWTITKKKIQEVTSMKQRDQYPLVNTLTENNLKDM